MVRTSKATQEFNIFWKIRALLAATAAAWLVRHHPRVSYRQGNNLSLKSTKVTGHAQKYLLHSLLHSFATQHFPSPVSIKAIPKLPASVPYGL